MIPVITSATPAAVGDTGWLPVLVGALVALGGGTGLTALLRARPERQQILVNAAQGAVVVQTSVLEAVRTDLEQTRAQVALLRKEVDTATQRADWLEEQNADLRHQNFELRARVAHLEAQQP